MAKLKSNNSFRKEHGYTRLGSLTKSKETKDQLQKKQARINRFTPAQNKQVADTIERNVNVKEAVKKGAVLNTKGTEPGYQGDQRYKPLTKKKIKISPKFRKSNETYSMLKKK
jgi:hypothetical protein